MRFLFVIIVISFFIPQLVAQKKTEQITNDSNTISILYTGRSLGALGVLRSQDEHELLTEQANTEKLTFKLVSHACWRAPGLTVFLPSDEPRGNELFRIISKKDSITRLTRIRAFRTQNVLLLQDPYRNKRDLLEMVLRNPRQKIDFPDLRETEVTVYFTTIRNGDEAFIIEEKEAHWPSHPGLWTRGEFNRIDLGEDSRLFELPVNLGEMAVRATVLKTQQGLPSAYPPILADLGQRTGNFGMDEYQRARIDFTLLNQLGYTISVPYHFELALGADSLKQLQRSFPKIRFLATNLSVKDSTLFLRHIIEEWGQYKIGFIGLVDPTIQGDLTKGSLTDFRFLPTMETTRAEVKKLRLAGVQVIIALSNFDPGDNADLAESVAGIDIIAADLHNRWSPETLNQTIQIKHDGIGKISKPGSPALVTRSFSNGIGVGHLQLYFSNQHLYQINHSLIPVTDHTFPDTVILTKINSMQELIKKPRGELMFPAFIDLIVQNPDLQKFDQITAQGRVSQQMWEEFVARLLRNAGPAELTILRKFPYFPPLIGKLHEEEVISWLWSEDQIVLCDIKGSALLKILADDIRGELIISGLTRPKSNRTQTHAAGLPSLGISWYQFNTRVMGRLIDPEAFYRVATTDVIFEGIRAADFLESRRIRRSFTVGEDGRLIHHQDGKPLGLRTFVLDELKRIRKINKGEKKYLDAISERLKPDPVFEPLLTFDFDRPTLWTSYNRKFNSDGYGSVPESRVTANNSWVIGASGRFKATLDGFKSALDLGLSLAYAKQNAEISKNVQQITESADDIKLDLTYRYKAKGKFQPFIRSQYDTEFTPTINPASQEKNVIQQALRGVVGIARKPHQIWRNVELASILEQDFGQNKAQFGFTARADGRFFLGRGDLIYSLRNDATYFLKSNQDTNRDLALRYNMVHELLVPLIDELSLSIAADFFFYKGKVQETESPGMSMLLRVGITYDRLWKPRYQPLF
ncbi:MAG: hypothetical protein SH818_00635 [Saprospiraceae bacterium]|nr:hypothetical protein [Saprospiraceae bacterium]